MSFEGIVGVGRIQIAVMDKRENRLVGHGVASSSLAYKTCAAHLVIGTVERPEGGGFGPNDGDSIRLYFDVDLYEPTQLLKHDCASRYSRNTRKS